MAQSSASNIAWRRPLLGALWAFVFFVCPGVAVTVLSLRGDVSPKWSGIPSWAFGVLLLIIGSLYVVSASRSALRVAAGEARPVAPTYDQQPPFWYSHATWVAVPFVLFTSLARTFQSLLLLALGVVPLFAFMLASVLWSRRHNVG